VTNIVYELPTKGDLDRNLSTTMHSARQQAHAECVRLTSEFASRGMGLSTSLIGAVVGSLDKIHVDAIGEAMRVVHAFAERMQESPNQLTAWARPHLENLGNAVLSTLPVAGFPVEHQRVRAQYQAVFQQRLDGGLRDVEIGFVKGAGFAQTVKMESKEEWISAAAALALLKPVLGEYTAMLTIAERAHDGIVRSRAARFVLKDPDKKARAEQDFDMPAEFWWARGHSALKQNWASGDFETWIRETIHLRAYGVRFLRADIAKVIPMDMPSVAAPTGAAAAPNPARGGRPKADWWDDLWVEICRQLYVGDLKPKTQSDIERGMHQWITDHDKSAGETTIRERANKLWRAIKDEN